MKIYLTKRNIDMTEGRGPMVNDIAFLHRRHAEEYIDTKEGVMGRKAKWSKEKYGDWCVQEIDVVEYSIVDEQLALAQEQREALNKLTPRQVKVLQLLWGK